MNARLPHAAPAPVHRFASLGTPLLRPVPAAPVPGPQRLWGNPALAAELGLPSTWWCSDAATAVLAGNAPWPGYAPQATVYAGHQFGRYTRQLGDGRALLIAELATAHGVQQLQLKGAGPTPYARGSDGRAVLRASVREALASEALHALGVPSTRALTLVGSPLVVQRDGPETAAIVCRVAPSFLRIGHLEYWAHSDPPRQLQRLVDWHITQHHPQWAALPQRHTLWLAEVLRRSAILVAQWQTLGFCHGVLNTDNISLLGLTLDHGPFAFMDRFRPHHIPNSSDTEGRYRWEAQPAVMHWNMARLLDACAPLLGPDARSAAAQAEALLAGFMPQLQTALLQRWAAKLGLARVCDGDAALVQRWLTLLQRARADFSDSFRLLGEGPGAAADPLPALRPRFAQPATAGAFEAWAADWLARVRGQGEPDVAWRTRMRQANPRYVLRNHLAQRVIDATQHGDMGPFHQLSALLARPFDEHAGAQAWAAPPVGDEAALEVSCSA